MTRFFLIVGAIGAALGGFIIKNSKEKAAESQVGRYQGLVVPYQKTWATQPPTNDDRLYVLDTQTGEVKLSGFRSY